MVQYRNSINTDDAYIHRNSLTKLIEETEEFLSVLSLTSKANPVTARDLLNDWTKVRMALRNGSSVC